MAKISKLTAIQRNVAKHYSDGDFAHVFTQADVDEAAEGDSFFGFLMRELGPENCPTRYRARMLLQRIRDEIAEVEDGLEEMR
jgi:hypothetical protein